MKANDIYEVKARIFPAVVSMMIPFILTFLLLEDKMAPVSTSNITIVRYAIPFIPLALVYAALGYFLRNLFCDISKLVIERICYGQDKHRMPTTEMLLWKDSTFDDSYKQLMRTKILRDFGLKLPSKESEHADINNARRSITGAIGTIRQICRHESILLKYNIRYGFWRNLSGGNLVGVMLVFVLMQINTKVQSLPTEYFWMAFSVIIMLTIMAIMLMMMQARDYARQLFSTYLTLNLNNRQK